MLKARGLIIMTVALALAAFAAVQMSGFLEKSAAPKKICIVAAADIPPNTLLTPDRLGVASLPASRVPGRSFHRTDQLATRRTKHPIGKGDVIVERLLVPGKPAADEFSGMLEPGMRAVSLTTRLTPGLAGLIRSGDQVDIVSALPVDKKKTRTISRVILTGVRVLAVTRQGLISGSNRQTVTLALTPEDAGILAACQATQLKLIKKNARDTDTALSDAVVFSVITGPKSLSALKTAERETEKELNRRMKEGFRAVTVGFNDDDGICGFIRPGNRVDILAVTGMGNISAGAVGEEAVLLETSKTAKIILQDVYVMAVDLQLDSPAGLLEKGDKKTKSGSARRIRETTGIRSPKKEAGPPPSGPVSLSDTRQFNEIGRVTLLLSPGDAEKLVVTYNSSRIKFIVRNQDDRKRIKSRGQKLVEAFWGKDRGHTVEFYRGRKESGLTFEKDTLNADAVQGRPPAAGPDRPVTDNSI